MGGDGHYVSFSISGFDGATGISASLGYSTIYENFGGISHFYSFYGGSPSAGSDNIRFEFPSPYYTSNNWIDDIRGSRAYQIYRTDPHATL
jgi:hypothetical protein